MWGIAYVVESLCMIGLMIYDDIDRNMGGGDYSDWHPEGGGNGGQ